jgi:hypothetical protein
VFLAFFGLSCPCKIFEHFALQVDPVTGLIQTKSTLFKDSTILAPKLADPTFWWKSNSSPSKSGSSLPDPDQLIFCIIQRCLLDEIHYLETRSRRVNKSFILSQSDYYPRAASLLGLATTFTS